MRDGNIVNELRKSAEYYDTIAHVLNSSARGRKDIALNVRRL